MNQVPLRVLVDALQALRSVTAVPYLHDGRALVKHLPHEACSRAAAAAGSLDYYVEQMLEQKVEVES